MRSFTLKNLDFLPTKIWEQLFVTHLKFHQNKYNRDITQYAVSHALSGDQKCNASGRISRRPVGNGPSSGEKKLWSCVIHWDLCFFKIFLWGDELVQPGRCWESWITDSSLISTKAQVFHLVIITKTWCWLPMEEGKSEPEIKLDR